MSTPMILDSSAGLIVIYVNGEQVLAPVDCIYVPYFAREADNDEGSTASR
jgi:hypothetical protein